MMTEVTNTRRINQLIEQVRNHTLRDEILKLAIEQLADDTAEVQPILVNA